MTTNTARFEAVTDPEGGAILDHEEKVAYPVFDVELAQKAAALFNAHPEDALLGLILPDAEYYAEHVGVEAEVDPEPETSPDEAIRTVEAFLKLLSNTEPAEDLPEGEERFVVTSRNIPVVTVPSDIVEDRMTGFEYGVYAGSGDDLAAGLNSGHTDVDALSGKAPLGTYASGDLDRLGAVFGVSVD